ncbi:MAG: RagB/SusD family nutrient uptake outer membrane protein [Niastella sp.]|nr:RagB/SusD family nutrient uptake outer membrane protein [Niastella sp.]
MTANKYLLYLIAVPLMMMAGCNKWLDVKPKTQVDAELLYEREAGFKDVLYGAYVNMASAQMYGREMTFGMVDALGNVYPNVGYLYSLVRDGVYTNAQVEPLITGIWSTTYNTLANLNNLISHLNAADRNMFAADNYNVIKGEALGLRGFLHFDMLRLFAPSFKANAAAQAIPYVVNYAFRPTAFASVSVVMDSVIADLKAAAGLLQQSDPIYTGRVINPNVDDGYLLNRRYHLNYYAIKAALARAYMYKGDLANAAQCADEVINSSKFTWIRLDDIATLDETRKDRSFKDEQVLVLDVAHLADNIIDRLTMGGAGMGSIALWYVSNDINSLYSFANDWRKLYMWTDERNSISNGRFNTKLYQPQGIRDSLARRMPLIRLPELYLISAEAAFDTDPEKARSRINTLRRNRGFEVDIPTGTPAAALRNELLLEYRREFICEGVLFYYYKRLDADRMANVPGNYNKQKYVLPLPVDETQFR